MEKKTLTSNVSKVFAAKILSMNQVLDGSFLKTILEKSWILFSYCMFTRGILKEGPFGHTSKLICIPAEIFSYARLKGVVEILRPVRNKPNVIASKNLLLLKTILGKSWILLPYCMFTEGILKEGTFSHTSKLICIPVEFFSYARLKGSCWNFETISK